MSLVFYLLTFGHGSQWSPLKTGLLLLVASCWSLVAVHWSLVDICWTLVAA
jgi:hypothetical protein